MGEGEHVPQSMTGFGRAEVEGEYHRMAVEIRTVNHRFLDVSVHLPRQFSWWEPVARGAVAAAFSRGRVDLFLETQQVQPPPRQLRVDRELALAYYDTLDKLKVELDLGGRLDINTLATLPDVFFLEDLPAGIKAEEPQLERALTEAIGQVQAARGREGLFMAGQVTDCMDEVSGALAQIKASLPQLEAAFGHRIRSRLEQLGLEADPDRLAAELVYQADRGDVSEEVVRLESHLEGARAALQQGSPGRPLNFMIQEMNREINTIGAKVSAPEVGGAVVDIKTRLEQMRELVQNLQ